jgi:hypothetical protein
LRQIPHQRWNCENLIACCQLRVLEQINNFNIVSPRQMFFADLFQVGEGRDS